MPSRAGTENSTRKLCYAWSMCREFVCWRWLSPTAFTSSGRWCIIRCENMRILNRRDAETQRKNRGELNIEHSTFNIERRSFLTSELSVERSMLNVSLLILCVFCVSAFQNLFAQGTKSQPSIYTFSDNHGPDGIGKFYQGREIAHVMGHEGSDWLERPERQLEERPDLLLTALQLRPGDVAADIGAGTGYFT